MTRFPRLLVLLLLAAPAPAQLTQRISVATGGAQAHGRSLAPVITGDSRFVAFVSDAPDLVPGDTNGCRDVFVHDRWLHTTERVSVSDAGAEGNGDSDSISLSADGRFVAFRSEASNLVAGDTNGCADIFVRDRLLGLTQRASLSSSGQQGNGACALPSLCADGSRVAFSSAGDNLVSGDTNQRDDVFVRDLVAGTTLRASVSTAGAQGNSGSDEPVLSPDGNWVSFDSNASTLVPGDTNSCEDVFLHSLVAGTTERVSVSSSGAQANAQTGQSSLSVDGRFVSFFSMADNLVPGDTNGVGDIFVRDRLIGTTTCVSVSSFGAQADLGSIGGWLSADGNSISFLSLATNLAAGDTNGVLDVYVRDWRAGTTTERVSVSSAGAQADAASTSAMVSLFGRFVVFGSDASTLVAGDTNADSDVFVHDRHASGFTSMCEPGFAGAGPCPCGNPPAGPGRGCNNSAATGGASLSASGVAYLSTDSLVLATSGELPSATSIVLQGTSFDTLGVSFGQGRRCAAGVLRRLFTKVASAGSIVAPQFGAGDPSISARSASLGDPIQIGETRWYLVYYRDPTVLGSCPAASTFNCTQGGSVSWQP